jgi:hypothetical protein
MAQVHGDQAEAREQEGDQQRDAVAVVEPGQQHDEQQCGEGEAGTRRQDVDAARGELQRQAIFALTAAGPRGSAAPQPAPQSARRRRRGVHI